MTRSHWLALFVAALTFAPAAADAQFGGLTDKFKRKAQQKVDQAEQKTVDEAFEVAEDAVKCAATDEECIAQAEEEGKEVVLTDKKGKPLPADKQPKKKPASAAAEEEEAGEGKPPAKAERVGEGAWANFDFVPGERVLFAEDYARDRVGNFPKRLEFMEGTMEMVEWKGRRFLRVDSESKFAVPLPQVLPERFTVELDVTIPWWGMSICGGPAGEARSHVYLSGSNAGLRPGSGKRGGAEIDPRGVLPLGQDEEISGKLVRLRIHGDGRYVKVYLDQYRIANVPNSDFERSDKLYFESSGFPPPGKGSHIPTLFGAISVNAGGREMYDALAADGRVVTQGIYFDTGSDKLRPESTPTLKEICAMMQEHPELKLAIEGHTDDVGNAASNQSLSENRAAAVKAWLVGSGVASSRLESKGCGQTKPVAPNDTPEGRQNNRRVELVKL